MVESAGASARCALRRIDVIVILIVIGLLVWLLFPTLNDHTENADRVYCKSNLKGIGMACATWAQAHDGKWPDEYKDGTSKNWDKVGETRNDWYEFDGTAADGVDPADTPTKAIDSNLANFWRLIVSGGLEPANFLCPNSSQIKDATVTNYSAVRDFRNVTYCSYSYQNVLGAYVLKSTTSANPSQLAVAADANPMRRDFWSGAPGGGVPIGVTNKELAKKPKFEEGTDEAKEWNTTVEHIRRPWELNSPNHKFKGQNVLYLDTHVEWMDNPYCVPRFDNIWLRRRTDVTADLKPNDIRTLRAYNDETSYNGTSTLPPGSGDDSFLVP